MQMSYLSTVLALCVLSAGALAAERDCYSASVRFLVVPCLKPRNKRIIYYLTHERYLQVQVQLSVSERLDSKHRPPSTFYFGYPAAFGPRLPSSQPTPPLLLWIADPVDGCGGDIKRIAAAAGSHATAALVQRGNCSFVEKAVALQAAGYQAMIMYDPFSSSGGGNDDDCIFMGSGDDNSTAITKLFAVTVTATAGKALAAAIANNNNNSDDDGDDDRAVFITLMEPPQSVFDRSEVVLWGLAVAGVTIGSLWAARVHTPSSTSAAAATAGSNSGGGDIENDGVITVKTAASFVFVASAVLLAMFFLLSQILAIVLTAFFALIAWQAAVVVLDAGFRASWPLHWRLAKFNINFWKWRKRDDEHSNAAAALVNVVDFVAVFSSTIITLTWLNLVLSGSHSAWIFQDILNFCIVLMFLSSVRLPNLKVATILLGSALLYDVWWVFLQPVVVGGPSVMVEVATGGGSTRFKMPMVFAVPRINSLGTNPGLTMLGLGDVVLPGLLVAMARRWDVFKQNRRCGGAVEVSINSIGYFAPMVGAYGGGLLVTFVALAYGWGGDQGQPALLYLSPSTLCMLCCLGLMHRELKELWQWEERPVAVVQNPSTEDDEDVERGDDDNEVAEGSEERAPLLAR